MEGRSFRHLHLAKEHSLILLRHQTGRHNLHKEHKQHRCTRQEHKRHPRTADINLDGILVFGENSVVAGFVGDLGVVVNTLPPFLRLIGFLLGPHHQRTECRTEHQRADARQTHRRRDGDAELGEERTGSAAHECHRDKHRHKHERTRDNRYRHFAHRFARSLNGFLLGRTLHLPALDLRHYGLHDDDSVIDDSTDGQHQSKEC